MNQKIEQLLQMSFEASEMEKEQSPNLGVGYGENDKTWEVIAKISGDAFALAKQYPELKFQWLMNNYVILKGRKPQILEFAMDKNVDYMEQPKLMYFDLVKEKNAACITTPPTNRNIEGLDGAGVIVAVIDSGIDISHPTFRKSTGETRIRWLLDQTRQQEYSKEELDFALANETKANLPGRDLIGHGTQVAEIACGNQGVAYGADILVVKMGMSERSSFPRTTFLMEAVDYALQKAIGQGRPVAINLSFGNNYGDHAGNSLVETYLDEMSFVGKNVICVGSGNEGLAITHTSGILQEYQERMVGLNIGPYETTLNVQIWTQYQDEIEVELITPTGKNLGRINTYHRLQRIQAEGVNILTFWGQPSPYSVRQEIYIDMMPQSDYIPSGNWYIKLVTSNVKSGRYDMWLPVQSTLNRGTGFLEPDAVNTFTVPSTASKVVSVGAYDYATGTVAPFSGRGVARITDSKPDLVAPGVNVDLDGIHHVTGTSFATPFVTGSAALLMQWGIINGNDPYLYGQKVKAYLLRGTKNVAGVKEYPSLQAGWGALCVRESFP